MTNTNKYYTPEIKEFHVGFEFEILTTDGGENDQWMKVLYGTDQINSTDASFSTNMSRFKFLIGSKMVRVKHLDKKDMSELEWFFCGIDDFGCDVFTKTIETGFNTGVKYYVHISSNNPGKIFIKWDSYSSYDFVSGQIGMNIKNKNEFEKFFNKLSIG